MPTLTLPATAPYIEPTLVEPTFEIGVVAEADSTTYAFFAYPGSLVKLPTGKLIATFTGIRPDERAEGVGCYSSDEGRTWSKPQTFFGGSELSESSLDINELYADPCVVVVDEQRVLLFCVSRPYGQGAELDLSRTRFWRRVSEDGGESFGPVEELPKHKKYLVGTVHPGLKLAGGRLVMGYSWDIPAEMGRSGSNEGYMDLRSGALISENDGQSWHAGEDIVVTAAKGEPYLSYSTDGIVEPSLVELEDGSLFLLGRTGTNNLWQSRSYNGGDTWEEATASPLVSHNCPAALLRLADGTIAVAYNDHPLERSHMSLRFSSDNCHTWSRPVRFAPIEHVESPEASYPQLCELDDGDILVIFGQNDKGHNGNPFSIRWVRFERASLIGFEVL